jgi:ATP-binding protein involved in chromosome partitioning
MKLDRKEILKALETITIAGEGKNMVESGAVANVITFGDEVVVDLLFTHQQCTLKKEPKMISKKQFTNWYLLKLKLK